MVRKAHFVKTTLALTLAVAGFALFAAVTVRIVFAGYWLYVGDVFFVLEQLARAHASGTGAVVYGIALLLPLACWWIAWLRVERPRSAMEFSEPKGIYLQIADQIRERVLDGDWRAGERIPSIRELAVELGVNPNTVTKSYQRLMDRGIISSRRGLGYFVSDDAREQALQGDEGGVPA